MRPAFSESPTSAEPVPHRRAPLAAGRCRRAAGRRRGSVTFVAVVAVVAVLLQQPAMAAPANPSDTDLTAAKAAQDAAAAEVGRLAGLVTVAEAELQRVGLQAQAAADSHLIAQAELEQAQAAASSAARELQAGQLAVDDARVDVATLGRESYMRGSDLTGVAALVNAEGPAELLQQVSTLELLGVQRSTVLDTLEVARVLYANADSAARETAAQVARAERVAADAWASAEARMASSQAAFDAAAAQMADYDRQLQQAQIQLLSLQGARNAHEVWRREQDARAAADAAERAAATRAAANAAERARQPATTGGAGSSSGGNGSAVAPTSGRFTTCYEMRWGTMHYGVDIASPIGTPIYAPMAGRVVRAGPASGFGLAVYIQHDDGSVTVYGHINDYFVSAGQRVSAGEVIAEVGNKGLSTGPHLHFEVHADGMYLGRTNPIPWLAERGVSMGPGCR